MVGDFGLGFVIGWQMQNKNEFGDDAQNLALCEQTRLGQKPDELINPLLACDTPVSKNSGNLELLKNKLTELIGGEIKIKIYRELRFILEI